MNKEFEGANKARTLMKLKESITYATVLPIYVVRRESFRREPERVRTEVAARFQEDVLIIRSSSDGEDTQNTSNAGKYKTVANVDKRNGTLLLQSIQSVFASYDGESPTDEVLIQPMLTGMSYAGVAFTCDIDTLAPYYCISYAKNSKGDEVTSGTSSDIEGYIHYKGSHQQPPNRMLSDVIRCCKELEERMGEPCLDVEFGTDEGGNLYLFQVRPVAKSGKKSSAAPMGDSLRKLHKKLGKLSKAHPDLLGDKALFGVMPDWNPAEIIGLRPRRLALSLYKELVTDHVWAKQRRDYGYRDVTAHPLIATFLGIPYVDIRISFNSFVPRSLNEGIANKLVNHYINKLCEIPVYHDKIEFKVVHSCYYVNLPQKLRELLGSGFNEEEIKRVEFSLLQLTNDIIDAENGPYKKDIRKIKKLERRYRLIMDSDLPTIDKIYWMMEDCKRYGTLPFAGVARAAFMGVQFLRSFLEVGILSREEYDRFMESVNTVNKQMNRDLLRLKKGEVSKGEFLSMYGHVRPGTYNILSERYDEDFDAYFNLEHVDEQEVNEFHLSEGQIKEVDRVLVQNGIKSTASELLSFIKESIEAREYAKFVFTKSLSKILQLVEELGKRTGLTKDDLSYLDIRKIIELYSTLDHRDIREIFQKDIQKNKRFYEYAETVRLPSLIRKPDDVYGFFLQKEEPNYITLKRVRAPVVAEEKIKREELAGKIVCIRSADPGYDFIFSKNIKGLVTEYGGANSHMAIRCAECGIPAVIGAGESNFGKWSKAKVLEIDSGNRLVKVLQ